MSSQAGSSEPALLQTHLPDLPPPHRGKVRDIYDFGETLLIVATDRISVFDVILPTGIPGKGKILTQLSLFWFEHTRSIVRNHLMTADPQSFPEVCRPYLGVLADRSMLVRKAQPFPVECVVRGYLAGSAWEDYRHTGRICDLRLPHGLQEAAPLEPPLFTPTTKAPQGMHDEPIPFATVQKLLGTAVGERVRALSVMLYTHGRQFAASRHLILADSKFEFGLYDGEVMLIDELFTPDSSRYWPCAGYQPGRPQPSFDKQFVRDYTTSLGWNRQPPGPKLPVDIVEKTRQRYLEAYHLLVGAWPQGV
ncbi:MAG TPA: phosphoribosylaminoimidazolesuccinocarboxamide synthase [Candidatus Tectomicrobia bacterium]|nr:phosphoribosylaminoimidazolesuccinocarboxamide synthase [Candidatus Tectomicrobia bacterium]